MVVYFNPCVFRKLSILNFLFKGKARGLRDMLRTIQLCLVSIQDFLALCFWEGRVRGDCLSRHAWENDQPLAFGGRLIFSHCDPVSTCGSPKSQSQPLKMQNLNLILQRPLLLCSPWDWHLNKKQERKGKKEERKPDYPGSSLTYLEQITLPHFPHQRYSRAEPTALRTY